MLIETDDDVAADLRDADLNRAWEEQGGKISAYHQPRGFCHAATQYWIAEILDGKSAPEITPLLRDNTKHVLDRQKNTHGRELDIPGTTHETIAVRSAFGRGQLKSRDALMDIVLNQVGVYSYSTNGMISGGHAMGFELDDDTFRFFDPNSGTYSMQGLSEERKGWIRAWFCEYWQRIYKKTFNKGSRKLVRYRRKPGDALLDIRQDPWKFNPLSGVKW